MKKDNNIVRAFSLEHVVKLTGLSASQLRNWDREDLFRPDYAFENRRSPHSRIYSFRDVVGLRAMATLMQKFKVSAQELKRVASKLAQLGFAHWADVKLYVVKGQVHFRPPGTNEVKGVWDGQLAMLPIIDVIDEVRERVDDLQKRSDQQRGKVERHRYVARNSPVISGTRIPTATIRRYREAGYSIEQIIQEYPTLTERDVVAALKYEEDRVA